MPIIWSDLPPLIQNSRSSYTTKQCISLVRSVLDVNDNDKIQDLAIRNYLNIAKSELVEKLTLLEDNWYSMIMKGTHELHPQLNILYIKLNIEIQVNQVYEPYMLNTTYNEVIHKIKSVAYGGYNTIRYPYSIEGKYGTCKDVPFSDIMQAYYAKSDMYAKTIMWNHSGSNIFIFNGYESVELINAQNVDQGIIWITKHTELETDLTGPAEDLIYPIWYNHLKEDIIYTIEVYRTPIMDDLLDSSQSQTLNISVDVPIRHIRLLTMMVQKMCIEQLGKKIDPNLEMVITQELHSLDKIQQPQQQQVKQ
jgi:hypothetical protein